MATKYKDNTPRVVNIGGSFFLIVEQDVLCDVDDLSEAVFLWFAIHYVFNIQYNKVLNNVGLFFQDNIFECSDATKRTATYNSIVGDITQFLC